MEKDKQTLVLLADEDRYLADIYIEFFKREKIKLVIEKDGEGALEGIKKKKPDLVIMEVALPKVDGFTVLERLKRSKATKDIPVILLTSLAQKEDVEKALALGVNDYLLKTLIKPQELVNKVKQILKKEE